MTCERTVNFNACSDGASLVDTKRDLSAQFRMNYPLASPIIPRGDITRARNERMLCVCQSRCAHKVIYPFRLSSRHEKVTFMDPSNEVLQTSTQSDEPYCAATGALMYPMVGTRRDTAYAIITLAKHVVILSLIQWHALSRAIIYVTRA